MQSSEHDILANSSSVRPSVCPVPVLCLNEWMYCDTFYLRDANKRGNSYDNVGGWVAGWVTVTLRYCIKTAKPIWKLFRPSESPIILVSQDPCADTQFQGELLHRGIKYTGVEKIGDFRRKSPFISETVQDRLMVTMER